MDKPLTREESEQLRSILHRQGIIALPNLADGWYALVRVSYAIGPFHSAIEALMQQDIFIAHDMGFYLSQPASTLIED